MTGVSRFTVDEDRVESVQLAVFAEQTLPIQIARRDVPDSHPLIGTPSSRSIVS